MKRRMYFPGFLRGAWTPSGQLSDFFLTTEGRDRVYSGGNDNWGLDIVGLYGTEELKSYVQDQRNPKATAVEVDLSLWFNPELGVLLAYSKFGGGYSEHFVSIGDLSKLTLWVHTLHDDLRPVGLFIPFAKAWSAVKEFMDRDGELPKAIEWISAKDLPPHTFPDPQSKVPTIETHGYPWERDPNWGR